MCSKVPLHPSTLYMNKILAIITVIALAGAGYYLYTSQAEPNNSDSGNPTQNSATRVYSSDTYDISFQYPENYVIEERDAAGSEMRAHHTIVLMDRDDAANIPQNGEGPTAITVDIFQNNLDRQTAEGWIKNSNNSNYKLAISDTLRSGTVGGVPALGYTWDGLYRGDSLVFEHKGAIIMMSVTYMSPEDRIRTDFAQILSSVELN